MGTKINKALAFDCETSGINFTDLSPATNYQMVSAGMIVFDVDTFEPIDELYLEIQWDGVSKWEDKAESIHGLSKKYLAENGVTPDQAAMKIAIFLDKHFGIDTPISLLGHNVVNFDKAFLKQFLWSRDLLFKFSHRNFDTFALSMGTIGATDSNQIIDYMGMKERGIHNALEDARISLKFYKIINKMWQKYVR